MAEGIETTENENENKVNKRYRNLMLSLYAFLKDQSQSPNWIRICFLYTLSDVMAKSITNVQINRPNSQLAKLCNSHLPKFKPILQAKVHMSVAISRTFS